MWCVRVCVEKNCERKERKNCVEKVADVDVLVHCMFVCLSVCPFVRAVFNRGGDFFLNPTT